MGLSVQLENPNHFLIIASQGSGNAILHGLLNAHSRIECLYQWDGGLKKQKNRYLQWEPWIEAAQIAEKKGRTWGNDAGYQPMLHETRGSVANELIQHIRYFKIIWCFRRLGGLGEKHHRSVASQEKALATYWEVKDAAPHRIIMVSFEDILLRTQSELRRICDFLQVRHEREMIQGLKKTGNPCFNYGRIVLDKV